MRRRIIVTMLAMVVGALALAGVGTYTLTALDSVHQTQVQLASEAQEFAKGIKADVRPHGTLSVVRTLINLLKGPLELQGEALLAVRLVHSQFALYNLLDPKTKVVLPSGLKAAQLNMMTEQFVDGAPVTGSRGRLVWAALLFTPPLPVSSQVNLVILLTREAPTGPPNLLLWFGLASGATLVVALAAANGLGRRIARPLRRTETVTRQIAAGDLEAKVVVSGKEGAEIVSLATSVNHMADSLAQARGTQRQFLMSVSHDLRTPLTSIKGFAEALADGTTTDVQHAAGIITSEARRLERLVTDLLELAKLESGAFSLRPVELDLSQLVDEAAGAFAPAASSLGLELRVSVLPDGGPPCWADPDRLAQVVANLVENALKYTSALVLVDVFDDEAGPGLAVQDDGPGIPAPELKRVFERLYQSRSTSGRNLGSGLGLAIVEELVTAMGGEVRAENAAGQGPSATGTRVVVNLPAARSAPGRASR